jgi:hypothetical protein
MSFDNGKEFAPRQDIAHALKAKIFFATPSVRVALEKFETCGAYFVSPVVLEPSLPLA